MKNEPAFSCHVGKLRDGVERADPPDDVLTTRPPPPAPPLPRSSPLLSIASSSLVKPAVLSAGLATNKLDCFTKSAADQFVSDPKNILHWFERDLTGRDTKYLAKKDIPEDANCLPTFSAFKFTDC